MKICILNGSPKIGKSTSSLLIEYLTPKLDGHEVAVHTISRKQPDEAVLAAVFPCDALIFVFSLYVDCLPSHLLRFLLELKKRTENAGGTRVYGLVNNGFFEGKQNHVALSIMKNWCSRAGLEWGMGAGFGAGEMLPMLRSVPLGHGPNKTLGAVLSEIAAHITEKTSGKDRYCVPNWPRFLWRIQATLFWNSRLLANGLKIGDVYGKPEYNLHLRQGTVKGD